MRKLGNDNCSFFNIVPSRYLDGFGITGKSVFYRTLLNKEHMVGAGNFGRKFQATISDAPYKYMY